MKIIITSPVDHDGKPLKVGATVDLPEAAADVLIAGGSAEKPVKAKAEDADSQKQA
jgi:hypothetical protein